MPLYEYECNACRKAFEQLVRATRKSMPPCPACGSRRVSRLWSVFSPSAGAAAAAGATCADVCGSRVGEGCAGGGCPMKEAALS